jgi:hypothetical protein
MRTTSRQVVVTALLGAVGFGSAYRLATAGLPEQKEPPPAKAGDGEAAFKKAMLEDARKVFEQDIARYKSGLLVHCS